MEIFQSCERVQGLTGIRVAVFLFFFVWWGYGKCGGVVKHSVCDVDGHKGVYGGGKNEV